MSVLLYAIAAVTAINGTASVLLIGKPRQPLTPALAVVFSAFVAVTLAVAAGQVH